MKDKLEDTFFEKCLVYFVEELYVPIMLAIACVFMGLFVFFIVQDVKMYNKNIYNGSRVGNSVVITIFSVKIDSIAVVQEIVVEDGAMMLTRKIYSFALRSKSRNRESPYCYMRFSHIKNSSIN